MPDCGIEEHTHSISCYSDPNADVETSADWEATLPGDLGIYWSENLVLVAESQLGYEESESNYILDADGITKQGNTYYLAYALTSGTQNTRWKNNTDRATSLYLRYTPEFTVTFNSDGFDAIEESVGYNGYPSLTEPNGWTRAGYNLIGWLASDNQTVYTYEELLARPVTQNISYTAQKSTPSR